MGRADDEGEIPARGALPWSHPTAIPSATNPIPEWRYTFTDPPNHKVPTIGRLIWLPGLIFRATCTIFRTRSVPRASGDCGGPGGPKIGRRSRGRPCHTTSKPPSNSAELPGPRTLLGIRTEIIDFEPDLDLKLHQTKFTRYGMVPTDRHTTIPNDSGRSRRASTTIRNFQPER